MKSGEKFVYFHSIVFSVYNFFVTPNHKVCDESGYCYFIEMLLVFATIEIASILYKRMFFIFQNVIHKLKEGTD